MFLGKNEGVTVEKEAYFAAKETESNKKFIEMLENGRVVLEENYVDE